MSDSGKRVLATGMVTHGVLHTYELSIPLFIPFWLDSYSVGEFTMGLIVGLGYALFGIGALPAGRLTDRFGPRRLILGCLFGMSLAFGLFSLGLGIVGVGLAVTLWGLAASVYHPAGMTMLSKRLPNRGRAFAFHGMAGNLGIGLGPLFTTALLIYFDWQIVAMLLAFPAALALVGAWFLFPTPSTDQRGDVPSMSALPRDTFQAVVAGVFPLVFVLVIASGLYYRGILTFLPTILLDVPALSSLLPSNISHPERYFYAGILLVGILGQYLGGVIIDRVRPPLAIGVAFGVLTFIAIAMMGLLSYSLGIVLVVGLALGIVLFSVQPMYQTAVAQATPPGRRGISYGITYLGLFGIGAIGAPMAGALFSTGGHQLLFGGLAGLAAGNFVLGSAIALFAWNNLPDDRGDE